MESSMSEKEFRDVVEKRLSKYFNLYKEQKGYYIYPDGRKSLKRVDLVIEHKYWTDVVFGIEFKHNNKKRGFDLGTACMQMKNYSVIEWNYKNNAKQWGQIPIIACPHLSLNYLQFIRGHQHDETHDHNNINSFLSAGFNIGEMRPKEVNGKRYMRICFANKTIWREYDFDQDIAVPAFYGEARKASKKFVQDELHTKNYESIIKNITKYRAENYGT